MKRIFFILMMIGITWVCTIIAKFPVGKIMELVNLQSPDWVNFILKIGFFLVLLSSLLFITIVKDPEQKEPSVI